MNLHRRITAVAGTLVLAWGAFVPMAHADVTDDEIAAAKAEESRAAGSVAEIEAQLAALEAEAGDLELASAQAEVANSEAQSRLWDAMDASEAAQIRANEAAAKVEEGRAELGRIGAAMYREGAGSISGANYLLGVDSLSEATDKARAYDLVGRRAKTDLNEFQALQDVADALQKEADRCFEEQTRAAEEAEKTARALEEQAAQAAERVAAINTERDKLLAVLAEKQGVTRELVAQQQREKAEAARKAAEAEAARLRAIEQERQRQEAARVAAQQAAAREAAARAAAQAQRQAAAQAQQQAAPVQAPAQVPAPSNVASVQNAAGLGDKIVAYARQFHGVPYVWGGTSPTAGWDCSGFTQYVYTQLGMPIPRTTYAVIAAGYRVIPAAQAKPGDLVMWSNGEHIGIYTGNGNHIAARRPGDITREGPLYGSYYFLRVANY
ncbi:MAG: C40 family peptidase [Actinomycetaceae bacterium]|nr:C40 family peptidase [Actinomycetaceae bacterium]